MGYIFGETSVTFRFSKYWSRFWMHYAGVNGLGKIATRLATLGTPPYYGRIYLAKYNPKGFISHRASLHHPFLTMGRNIFIEDGVLIFRDNDGGPVELGDAVHLYRDTIIQTGEGGSIIIGSRTHIQRSCQFSAYKAPILIGQRVAIAPYCAFYSYNHGMATGEPIYNQPLQSKGGITIEDDAWLGVGVIVLDGVRIGKGAVVGAGSVVTKDIPDYAVALGNPASIVKMRGDL